MTKMRAKLEVTNIQSNSDEDETLTMRMIRPTDAYPDDVSDEDNTFARFNPTVDLTIYMTKSNVVGTFNVGQKFYVDFTEVGE